MNRRLRTFGNYLKAHWFWLGVNLAAAMPLVVLVWDYTHNTLSVDPVSAINNRTGLSAIVLLLAGLACTPANTITGFRKVLTVRKTLGLWAFFYACLHLLNFVVLNYFFDFQAIVQDALLTKPYILAGLGALLILVPLAITSTRGWMRRLGRNWKRLHRFVYAAGILAVLHFLWQAKAAARFEPLLYALVLALLLILRIPALRRAIVALRLQVFGRRNPPNPVAVPAGRRLAQPGSRLTD
jgi:methionine sulfoxide reductase heme-binding subunit